MISHLQRMAVLQTKGMNLLLQKVRYLLILQRQTTADWQPSVSAWKHYSSAAVLDPSPLQFSRALLPPVSVHTARGPACLQDTSAEQL